MLRTLTTFNLKQLADFQPNKNRRYTQLQSGRLSCHYQELRLGRVQLLREKLDVGARIEAAPAADFIPFAVLLPQTGDYHFCNDKGNTNGLIQAGGGSWDIRFQGGLDYVGTVFNRQYLSQGYESLTGQSIPEQFMQSRITPSSSEHASLYAKRILLLFEWFGRMPQNFHSEVINGVICAELLRLLVQVLTPGLQQKQQIAPLSKRIKGVQKVLEYIHYHSAELPDIKSLCQVASLSERSLQYGFQEYMGISPVQYLRTVRLNGARQQLQNASKDKHTVSAIALDWGFLELGRFARDYKQLFLELPSETLAR